MPLGVRRENRDHDYNAKIFTTVAVSSALSLFAVILRLMSRKIKCVALSYDDYLIVFAWVLSLAMGITIALGMREWGLGQHISQLTEETILKCIKVTFALSILQPTSLASAKLSVLLLLHRVLVTRGFRLTVRLLGATVIGWWIAVIVADAIFCSPIPTHWDSNTSRHFQGQMTLNRFFTIPWVLTDFAILIAPMPVVRSLQLPRGEKILLYVLFLTGGMTCIVSCIRYSKLFYSLSDITWQTIDSIVWSLIEANVTVICACLVAVKPALIYLFPEKLITAARFAYSKLKSSSSSGRGSSSHPPTPSTVTPFGSRTRLQERSPQLPLSAMPADLSGTQLFHEALSTTLHSIKIGRSPVPSAEAP